MTTETSDGVAVELLRELHGFLAQEAPFLAHRLPARATLDELEAHVLQNIAEQCAPDPRFAGVEMYPGRSLAGEAAATRDALVELARSFFARQRVKASLTADERRLMLRTMLLARAVDDVLKDNFDKKPLKWNDYPSPQKGFRSTGQEAIVGAALRLRRPPAYAPGAGYKGDILSPLIRDLPAMLMFMPDPLNPILAQGGLEGTPFGGRDLHVGDLDWGVLPPSAPLAISTQNIAGMAYAWKLRGEDRVGLTCIGDGASSLGEWHEAVNFAGVQKLALVFVLQNNRWALGTHTSEQSATRRFALRGAGYGIPGITVFGNDPDEVAAACAWAADRARAGHGPALIELVTYRRPGHAHHDDDRFHGNAAAGVAGYEYDDERLRWEAADPIALYQARLLADGVVSAADVDALRAEAAEQVGRAVDTAARAAWPRPEEYRSRVYAVRGDRPAPPAAAPQTKRMAYDEAVRQALIEQMQDDERVFVLGEDVGGRYGGAFGVTRGLAKQFGAARCLNTPIAESAIVGCAVGAALEGLRPVVEMQFADFLATGFNALVNNAAKQFWRSGREMPLVVRLPYGGATGTMNRLLGGGPFHSQCPEMWFVRTPGWKVVAPSTPADAKGLMAAAIREPNPVIFLESKGLYGFFRTDLREDVPLGADFEVPLGKAAVRRAGRHVSVLTYGAMTWTALQAAEELAREGIELEVLDLRSLVPLDEEAIAATAKKTGRVIVLHEDTRRGGLGGELAALLSDDLFWYLDAPVRRVTAPDTPVPYSPPLEYDFLPKAADVVAAARELARI